MPAVSHLLIDKVLRMGLPRFILLLILPAALLAGPLAAFADEAKPAAAAPPMKVSY